MFPDVHTPALELRFYCTGKELKIVECECLYSPLDKYIDVALETKGYSGISWYKISFRADCPTHNTDGIEFSYHVH